MRVLGKALLSIMWGLLIFGLLGFLELYTPSFPEPEKELRIPKGKTLKEIARMLKEEGLVRMPFFISLYGRFSKLDRNIKAGIYVINHPITPLELLRSLKEGNEKPFMVVIPEGFTTKQIAELLEKRGIIASQKQFLQFAQDRDFLLSLGINAPSIEGFLFPDTYKFSPQQDPKEVIKIMVDNFRNHWPKSFSQRAKELGFDEYEILILASIIEKETALPREKPLVSAVFHNRLKRGMPLCADPTVIYGLGESFKGNLTRTHLRTPSPYNTYLKKGLPPTPICNPGLQSIEAALYPAPVPYLYFVSRNDGSHYFSRTLLEHNQAVFLFQTLRLNKPEDKPILFPDEAGTSVRDRSDKAPQ
jgi:UPF0755 protein